MAHPVAHVIAAPVHEPEDAREEPIEPLRPEDGVVRELVNLRLEREERAVHVEREREPPPLLGREQVVAQRAGGREDREHTQRMQEALEVASLRASLQDLAVDFRSDPLDIGVMEWIVGHGGSIIRRPSRARLQKCVMRRVKTGQGASRW
ncbi:MAG: hypothetical protein ACOC7V_14860 [Spirochaetota bacterium]